MKISNIILITFIVFGTFSCQKSDGFLDKKSTAELDEKTVFADSARTIDFLTGLYSKITFNITFGEGNTPGDFSKISDEAEGRYPAAGNFDKQVTQGAFSGGFYNQLANDWSFFFACVRHANIYLKNVDNSPLSQSLKTRTKAEARFLRAYFYHYLLKYFGGFPIMGDNVYTIDNESTAVRNTFAECVEYIINELDAISQILPPNHQGLNYGRITKGASLALKSRVLLYAASPLFNGGSFAEKGSKLEEQTAYPTADQNRWETARLAAKAVIDMNTYSLLTDNNTRPGNGFYQVFLTRINSELIFAEPKAPGNQYETSFNPRSRGGSWFYYYPTQDLVDMFPMNNGKMISDPTSGYNPNNPYINRDPRFGFTIIYNGSLYYLQSSRNLAPIWTYSGAAQDGIVAVSSNTATITGYYLRKFCDEMVARNSGGNTQGSVSIIRYAEILLNYAEAANEMGMTEEALQKIKELRLRAGILPGSDNRYGIPQNTTKEEARNIIRNERAIELAFEQHRYWDVRRWRLGEEYDGKYVHGMRITQANVNSAPTAYQKIQVRTRYFKVNSYLFPIPQAEVALNVDMLQNPGW